MDVYSLDPGNPVCNQSRVMNAVLFSCWQFLQQLSWLPMAGNGLHSAPLYKHWVAKYKQEVHCKKNSINSKFP
jgi:hypothetical protein